MLKGFCRPVVLCLFVHFGEIKKISRHVKFSAACQFHAQPDKWETNNRFGLKLQENVWLHETDPETQRFETDLLSEITKRKSLIRTLSSWIFYISKYTLACRLRAFFLQTTSSPRRIEPMPWIVTIYWTNLWDFIWNDSSNFNFVHLVSSFSLSQNAFFYLNSLQNIHVISLFFSLSWSRLIFCFWISSYLKPSLKCSIWIQDHLESLHCLKESCCACINAQ